MSNCAMSNETDLDWLARNVHEWPIDAKFAVSPGMGEVLFYEHHYPHLVQFSRNQWLARRAELQNKPSWANHQWPQIFQNEDGNWFGARAGWDFKAHIGGGWKGEVVSLLRDDGEYLQSGEVIGDWRDTLEKRPEQDEFKPFTSIEGNQEQGMKQDNGWFERGELPPVGLMCDIRLSCWNSEKYEKVTIVAITNEYLIVKYETFEQHYMLKDISFRPIRTERELEIEEMMKTINVIDFVGTPHHLISEISAVMYDAGYRKGSK